jgi:predicted adenylyl cyclase CyaB
MFAEKEIKILNIEYAVLVHHLEALWAKRIEPTIVRDRYYDSDDSILRNKKQRLRLRSQWDTTVITQKTKIPHKFMKSMTEQDITVENIQKWHQLLQELWLQTIKYKEKTRISYYIEDMHFDIDCYKNIPILLEIEWPTLEKINHRIYRLGLQYHTQVKWWSNKLFKHYNKQ